MKQKEKAEEMKKNPDEMKFDSEENAETTNPFQKQNEDLKNELDGCKQRLLRLQADFMNYKRRIDRENNDFKLRVQSELITSLLPVLDDFERALNHKNQTIEEQAYLEGFKLIYRNFWDILAKCGVEEIKAEGEILDPNYHEAISRMQVENCREDQIFAVAEKGYKINDITLRPAKVVVGYTNEEN